MRVGVNRSHFARVRVLRQYPHACGGEAIVAGGEAAAQVNLRMQMGELVTPDCWGIDAAVGTPDTTCVRFGICRTPVSVGTGMLFRHPCSSAWPSHGTRI